MKTSQPGIPDQGNYGQQSLRWSWMIPPSWYSYSCIIPSPWIGAGFSDMVLEWGRGNGCHFQDRLQKYRGFCFGCCLNLSDGSSKGKTAAISLSSLLQRPMWVNLRGYPSQVLPSRGTFKPDSLTNFMRHLQPQASFWAIPELVTHRTCEIINFVLSWQMLGKFVTY